MSIDISTVDYYFFTIKGMGYRVLSCRSMYVIMLCSHCRADLYPCQHHTTTYS